MLAYRSTPADHFAPQPSSSRAPAPLPPPPRAPYTSASRPVPTLYDSAVPSAYAAAPPPRPARDAAPAAPPGPAAAPAGGMPLAGGAATTAAGRTDKGKLTEQWGAPPDVVKRDKEYLERGRLLGEVSDWGRRGGGGPKGEPRLIQHRQGRERLITTGWILAGWVRTSLPSD